MVNEAVKSIRSLTFACFIVCMVWFFSLPTISHILDVRLQAQHLLAWLKLKEMVNTPERFNEVFVGKNGSDYVLWAKYDSPMTPKNKAELDRLRRQAPNGPEPLSADSEEEYLKLLDQSARRYAQLTRTQNLKISDGWPNLQQVRVELYFIGKGDSDKYMCYELHHYAKDVEGSTQFTLPYKDYIVIVRDGQARVTPDPWKSTPVPLKDSTLQDYYDNKFEPRYWNDIKITLASEGLETNNASSLSFNKPVSDMMKESMQASFGVFGLNMSAGLFVSSIGLLLAAAAFSLLGPFIALKESKVGPVEDPWLGIKNTTRSPFWIELAALGLTSTWVLMPLAVLVIQWQCLLDIDLMPLEYNLVEFGWLGLIFTAYVGFRLARELRRLRRAKIPEPVSL